MENKPNSNVSENNISMTIKNIDTVTEIGFKNFLLGLFKKKYPEADRIDIVYRKGDTGTTHLEIQVTY